MANTIKKEDMIKVLTEAGVTFCPEDPMTVLRSLYDEVVNRVASLNLNDNSSEASGTQKKNDDVTQTPDDEIAQKPTDESAQMLTPANRMSFQSWSEQMEREQAEQQKQLQTQMDTAAATSTAR